MSGIRVASAGAGTGKTYYLTHRVADAIRGGVAPESIVATTFTRKAAAELRERVREVLLADGRYDDAQRLFEGYIDTVHSVCARLLSEYAVDAGLSPALEVMPEGEDTRFFRVAVASIVASHADEIEPAATRLERDGSGSGYAKRPDWRNDVQAVVDLARSNAIDAERVRAMGRESADRLITLLGGGGTGSRTGADAGERPSGHTGDAPRADTTEGPGGAAPPRTGTDTGAPTDGERATSAGLFARLDDAVEGALRTLRAIDEPKQKTAGARDALESFATARSEGTPIRWGDVVRLSKLGTNKDAEGTVDGVVAVAAELGRARELHDDLRTLVAGVTECAAEAIDAYSEYKRRQGLMDYVDQESIVLELARENGRVRAGLADSLGSMFVDEFQDTSPIQLALFLALHERCGDSLWVGDPKQAIYGFRGTDPSLMNEATARLGTHTTLDKSWRSSTLLVELANALFAPALGARGYQAVSLGIPIEREEEAAGGRIETWYLDSKNQANDAKATAAGVAHLLAERTDLAPGDIAVLCRKNDECARIAAELRSFGIDASVGHGALSETPECRLATAALRYLHDPGDTLALAEIVHIHPDHAAHDAWLGPLIASPAEALGEWRGDPLIERLDAARESVARLAPGEALERAIELVGLDRLVDSWSRPARRRANLDALRGTCASYLDSCAAQRSAATVPGFIRYFGESAPKEATGTGPDTVQVLTYHLAKGLEWPLVVLTSLDRDGAPGDIRSPFGVSVEGQGEISLDAPLSGRALRYWPWPFGRQENVPAIARPIKASREYAEAVERAHDEALRLLYVGVTRARNELVLAVRRSVTKSKGPVLKTAWLDSLTGAAGTPLLRFPAPSAASESGEAATLGAGDTSFETLLRVLAPGGGPATASGQPSGERHLYRQPHVAARVEHPPAHLSPSSLEQEPEAAAVAGFDPAQFRVTLYAELGGRIGFQGAPDQTALGTAVHEVFAAAYPGIPEERLARVAERLLDRWGVAGSVAARDIVTAHHRLAQLIASTWPEAEIHREWPVSLVLANGQEAQGWIDLLVKTPGGCVIIDHKTYPGRDAAERLQRYGGQLSLYQQAVEQAGAGPVTARLLHLPFLGIVYAVE